MCDSAEVVRTALMAGCSRTDGVIAHWRDRSRDVAELQPKTVEEFVRAEVDAVKQQRITLPSPTRGTAVVLPSLEGWTEKEKTQADVKC